MVVISNFQPVSTDDNLILPSDFIFSCDFESYLPQPLSTPCFMSGTLCDSSTSYPSAGSHPTPRALLGTPVELTGLGALSGHPVVAGGSGRCNVTPVALSVPQRGWQGAQPRVGRVQDSQRQQHRGEGVLPMLLGAYPCPEQDCVPESRTSELCRWCFPALRRSLST